MARGSSPLTLWLAVWIACATACGGGEDSLAPDAAMPTCAPGAAGVECRPAAGPCDVPEVCDGISTACPPDLHAADGAACDDGNACTQRDTCSDGSCVGAEPVMCGAADVCHVAGTCDPATGACSNPPAPQGKRCGGGTCSDNAFTADVCDGAGTCAAAAGIPEACTAIDPAATCVEPEGCVGACFAAGQELPAAGTVEVLPATIATARYGACGVYDAASGRIYVVGGYDHNGAMASTIDYYDVGAGTTGTLTGTLPAGGGGPTLITGSCAVIDGRIWYAAYSSICDFDIAAGAGSCDPAWAYPSPMFGAAIVADRDQLYVVGGSVSTWRFDTTAALAATAPWTALPDRAYTRLLALGAAYYDGWLYAIGGGFETEVVERMRPADASPSWSVYGSLPGDVENAGFVQVDQFAIAVGGELDFVPTLVSIAYDLSSGQSRPMDLSLPSALTSASAVRVGSAVYVIGGYNPTGFPPPGASAQIAKLSLDCRLHRPAAPCDDGRAPSGTQCRPAVDICDDVDRCDGLTARCEDLKLPGGTSCRPAANGCDAAETCDGVSIACPPDALWPDGTICNDGNACTRSDTCLAGTCVGSDPVLCECFDGGTCDPSTGACSGAFAAAGTICNASCMGSTLAYATCDGAGACAVPGVADACDDGACPACSGGACVTAVAATSTTLAAALPGPREAGCAVFDPGSRRIYVVNGASSGGALAGIDYYDVDAHTTGTLPAPTAGGGTNYDTDSCAILDSRLWYASATGVCSYDLVAGTSTCKPAWTYPSFTFAPAMTTDGHALYVIGNYGEAWEFDVSAALANHAPWSALPAMAHPRDSYAGAAYRDGWLYVLGGSSSSQEVERIRPSDAGSPGWAWQGAGELPGKTYGTAFVQVGSVVYAISGEADGTLTSTAAVYDLVRGGSSTTTIALPSARRFAGAVRVDDSIYVLAGRDGSDPVATIEQLSLTCP